MNHDVNSLRIVERKFLEKITGIVQSKRRQMRAKSIRFTQRVSNSGFHRGASIAQPFKRARTDFPTRFRVVRRLTFEKVASINRLKKLYYDR